MADLFIKRVSIPSSPELLSYETRACRDVLKAA